VNLGQRWGPLRHTSDAIRHCAGTTVGQTLLTDGSVVTHITFTMLLNTDIAPTRFSPHFLSSSCHLPDRCQIPMFTRQAVTLYAYSWAALVMVYTGLYQCTDRQTDRHSTPHRMWTIAC